ncbi:GCV H and FTSW RODA SPOVE domain containing prote in [Trichuris trichiura]|uniref:GCV H and FTSW RODA SPOVE domain containing prote in n=1 Tax=Trichuris trichiura TaxID=36087 RepID=A0A077ZLY6_TRITR|nr:GCV H and FTSW RODA SPOVE domain containing prote in [Trichuris trichiura]
MFLMSGISWLILVPTIILAIIVGGTLIFLVTTDTGREILSHIGFKNYQFARIDSWLEPFHDPQGKSYQLARALMAIGSGGVFGTGYNVSNVYVPVRESDMIFTVIGENFGFIGGAFVILIYFILIYRMIRLCFDMNNEFYAYIASGIVMMMLFHVFENIGANIGLLPLTGIPLPFISQGGSSILGNMIGIDYCMGLTAEMADTLGEVTFISLPKVGQSVKAGEPLLEIEAEKAVQEFKSPLTGVVSSVSEKVVADPAALNVKEELDAWILSLREVDVDEFENL